ncbi:monooxygenase [Acidothermaceae bacterium B102]|nr:monooxygenase [Acidothermaceae bacterium B102]
MESSAYDADVLVVGAGPVGLWLAAELRLGGASVVILEKRHERSPHSRALTLHARTLELFAMRGIVEHWLSEGVQIPTTHYAMLKSRLDLRGLDTDYPFALFIPQLRTEQLLETYVRGLGVDIVTGVSVTDVEKGDDGVRVLAGERSWTGRYLVGCDGRRSPVRASVGIGYTGTEDALTCVLGDVILDQPDVPHAITMHTDTGSFYAVKIDPQRHRLIGVEHASLRTPRQTVLELDEFRDTIVALTGSDFGMRDPSWLTRVGSATFQADHYRSGRVLVAGDAAHVHFPMGGQGLNLGLQDAMNLGWKLARAVAGDRSSLPSYETERIPAGRLVIDDTLAQTALVSTPGREGRALRDMMTAVLADNQQLNATLALAISGIGATYAGPGTAGLQPGDRVPNLTLTDGRRLFELLGTGQFCLLGSHAHHAGLVVADAAIAAGHPAWDHRTAALVRPDGHLAWSTDERDPGRRAELTADAVRAWLPVSVSA